MGLIIATLGFGMIRRMCTTLFALLFALLGAAVAMYQYVLQYVAMTGGSSLPCPSISALPSCDKIYILKYGYITIPMIALSAFVWITFLLIFQRVNDSATDSGEASRGI
jgi:hypothetical protein